MTEDECRSPKEAAPETTTKPSGDQSIGSCAVDYVRHHWKVFPLIGKVPAIRGGRGVLDATDDIEQVTAWWSGRYRGCNIGGRIPESMIVLDTDPRHGGDESLAKLIADHEKMPETYTHISGRGDGGMHLFLRRPSGKLSAKRLGAGIDLSCRPGMWCCPRRSIPIAASRTR